MQAQEIEVKGIKNSILIEIKEGDWRLQEIALFEHIDQNKDFFKGAKLVIDVGSSIKVLHLRSASNPLLTMRKDESAEHCLRAA